MERKVRKGRATVVALGLIAIAFLVVADTAAAKWYYSGGGRYRCDERGYCEHLECYSWRSNGRNYHYCRWEHSGNDPCGGYNANVQSPVPKDAVAIPFDPSLGSEVLIETPIDAGVPAVDQEVPVG
ncbi:MAG: hypothetical protein ACT4PT_12655 [Methanobacteriota archaeon]